jgi:sulfide:quinone oxidoreductase
MARSPDPWKAATRPRAPTDAAGSRRSYGRFMTSSPDTGRPLNVLIAGGGVAALETLMALHELAGPRVRTTLLSPTTEFVYAPLSVREPFATGPAARYPLARIADDFGAELHEDALAWVAPGQHAAFTASGAEIDYDVLVLTLGARRERPYEGVTTFTGGDESESLHGLVQDVEGGYVNSVAFVVPPGVTWPLPLYELALMTAARAREMSVAPELTIVTPEEAPLAVFGPEASADVAQMLDAAGIAIRTSAYAEVTGGRMVALHPSGEELTADRVVAVPTLHGTAPRGVPADSLGFIPTDGHGRVPQIHDVYAAGDGVGFPIKQGGIATQQADAVAEVIAKRAGAPLEPRAFRPVMRGLLFTGTEKRFLRGEVSRGRDGVSEAAGSALWWPPSKISGRYLSAYLEAQPIS